MERSISVYYFGRLRERLGLPGEELVLPEGVETVGALISYLSSRSAIYSGLFRYREAIRCSVNQELVDFTWPVCPGDEVAFFPPITGG